MAFGLIDADGACQINTTALATTATIVTTTAATATMLMMSSVASRCISSSSLPPSFPGGLSEVLVACNVYVSAGGGHPIHRRVLQQLLQGAQSQCKSSPSSPSSGDDDGSDDGPAAVVVHAYADPVYNRSSFHLAGAAPRVAEVASDLANGAIRSLRRCRRGDDDDEDEAPRGAAGFVDDGDSPSSSTLAYHPSVGLVDHVAVMPLFGRDELLGEGESIGRDGRDDNFVPRTASGWAARFIGESMLRSHGTGSGSEGGTGPLQVHYYGSAHPRAKPLAEVRRERTNFFKSGGMLSKNDGDEGTQHHHHRRQQQQQREVATVGAPLCFVENYNLRLSSRCSRRTAQSLTRYVRERDGMSGLVGVEALTLPYSGGRWEVACNLLRPDLASAEDIQKRAEQWERELEHQASNGRLLEFGYRVGTTAEQCVRVLDLLRMSSSKSAIDASKQEQAREKHDAEVMERFLKYMEGPIER